MGELLTWLRSKLSSGTATTTVSVNASIESSPVETTPSNSAETKLGPARDTSCDPSFNYGLEMMATNGRLSYVRRTRWLRSSQ